MNSDAYGKILRMRQLLSLTNYISKVNSKCLIVNTKLTRLLHCTFLMIFSITVVSLDLISLSLEYRNILKAYNTLLFMHHIRKFNIHDISPLYFKSEIKHRIC